MMLAILAKLLAHLYLPFESIRSTSSICRLRSAFGPFCGQRLYQHLPQVIVVLIGGEDKRDRLIMRKNLLEVVSIRRIRSKKLTVLL